MGMLAVPCLDSLSPDVSSYSRHPRVDWLFSSSRMSRFALQASTFALTERGKSWPARIIHPIDSDLADGENSLAPRVPRRTSSTSRCRPTGQNLDSLTECTRASNDIYQRFLGWETEFIEDDYTQGGKADVRSFIWRRAAVLDHGGLLTHERLECSRILAHI